MKTEKNKSNQFWRAAAPAQAKVTTSVKKQPAVKRTRLSKGASPKVQLFTKEDNYKESKGQRGKKSYFKQNGEAQQDQEVRY